MKLNLKSGDWILADTFGEFVPYAPYTRIKILKNEGRFGYYAYHFNPMEPDGHEHGLYDPDIWPVQRKMTKEEIQNLPKDVLEAAE
jgi:hypothetical protein